MSAKKSLILFDIDMTLFNTDILRDLLKQALATTLNVPEKEIADCFLAYSDSLPQESSFQPKDFLTFLSRRFHAPYEKLLDVFFEPEHFQRALYPETIPVLSDLRNQGYTLGLYSQGKLEWQEYKILANNLMPFFDQQHQYIREEKKDPGIIENLPENTIIIDDKPEIIAFLETFPQIIPLHIVRSNHQPIGEFTLSSLNDLFPILDSLRHA